MQKKRWDFELQYILNHNIIIFSKRLRKLDVRSFFNAKVEKCHTNVKEISKSQKEKS